MVAPWAVVNRYFVFANSSFTSVLQLPHPKPAPVVLHRVVKSVTPLLMVASMFPLPTWLQEHTSLPRIGFAVALPLNNVFRLSES